MFHVGQKVVCVDASNQNPFGTRPLVEGNIYTVERGCGTYGGPEFIILVGIAEGGSTRGFLRTRFRPIVSRQTDISIFKALLEPNAKLLEGV